MRRYGNRVGKTFDDAVRSFKTAGPLRTAQRALERFVPERVLSFNQIVAVEGSIAAVMEAWQNEPLNNQYHHRWSTREDLDLLTRGGHTPERVLEYFEAGARAVITTLDGEMLGYSWLVPDGWISKGWLRVTLGPNELWGGYAYTEPEHRGKRILPEARKFAYPQLITEGCERVLGFVDALNRSSLRAGSTPARKYVGRIFYIRLLSFVIYRVDKKWGAGFWNEKRPYELSFDVFDRAGPSQPPSAAVSEYKGPRNY